MSELNFMESVAKRELMETDPQCRQSEAETKRLRIEKLVRPPVGSDWKNEPGRLQTSSIVYTTAGRKGFWPLFHPDTYFWLGADAEVKDD